MLLLRSSVQTFCMLIRMFMFSRFADMFYYEWEQVSVFM